MTKANVARRRGDDFQGRIFWLNAARLLDEAGPVVRVAYEQGPKAFDDVVVEYDPVKAPLDHEGERITREFVQCKWHARAGTFGYEDLAHPAFINASRVSLLERALEAQRQLAPDGRGFRFQLLTNWRIASGDPLLDLIGKSSDAIEVDRLFDGTTDRSATGKVRKLWREHLRLDDNELRKLVRMLSVAESPESSEALRERLDDRFAAVGLKRVPVAKSAFLYDDLIAKLLGQGRIEFDRQAFREMAKREGILGEPANREGPLIIGVRSFVHAIDHLENRCDKMLDLVSYFDGRYVRRETDWQQRIAPTLQAFLVEAAKPGERLRLVLDAHVSLAFAAGAVLNVKSGRQIEIEQRTQGRRFWSREDMESDSSWSELMVDEEVLVNGGGAVALAIGLTHDVSPATSQYVQEKLTGVGRILHCRTAGGASQQSVQCGEHAWQLAEKIVGELVRVRGRGHRASPVHLFIAGPNGFAFFLGQQRAMGPACVYEWDFEGQRGGGYSPGIYVV